MDDLVDSVGGSGDDNSSIQQEAAVIKPPLTQEQTSESTVVLQEQKSPSTVDAEPSVESNAGVYETWFHHTTTGSIDGGKSLVLCPGQRMDFNRCTAGGRAIPFHGYDEGRVIYWNMYEVPGGDIVCVKNNKTYRYRADSTVVYGSCR